MKCATKTGILVIAHGSRNREWVDHIETAIVRTEVPYPITTGYLELVEGKKIEAGIHYLESRGVNRIIVIPLFISSGSTHLEEIQYSFGLIKHPRIPTNLPVIQHASKIHWTGPLDTHFLVLDILSDRLKLLAQDPSNENVLLIAHGSEIHGFKEKWEWMLQELCAKIQTRFSFHHVAYATLHPDTIVDQAERLSRTNRLIVLPIFVSGGYFTNELIPSKLRNVSCEYKPFTYLPHLHISKWIEAQVSYFLNHSGGMLNGTIG